MNDETEEEVRAFVGPRADYYIKKWWLDPDRRTGIGAGINWAALFLSGLWLPYRKMYRETLIFFGVILLETLLEDIVYVGFLGRPEAPGTLGRFVGLVAGIVCGGFGNEWYQSHAQKTIGKLRSQGLPEAAYIEALTKSGGTSIAASLGFFVLFILAMGVVVTLSEFFLKSS